jgi:ABC-type bacteriocin/lantibiotic exporter with double-glycine peptidase domain
MLLVAFVIGGVAMTGITQLMQLRIVENLAQKIFSRASFEFAYRIPKIKQSAFYNYYAPELANRFFDTVTIQKGLPKILIDFSLSLFQIIVGLIVLSLYHSFFILFSLVLLALIYIILVWTGPKGLKTSIEESTYKYKIAFWLEEIARARLSFKLVADTDLTLNNTNTHVGNYLVARESHFKVLLNQFLYLIGFKVIIAAGLLISGSILVFNQEMNIGQFVAAEIIIILIIASVEKLIKSLDSIYDVLTALEKIGYVTDMPLSDNDGIGLNQDNPHISVAMKNVSFRYPDSSNKTLEDISFEIPAGKSAYLKGPASSGKTTILKLLAGIFEPESGIIKFNGFPLKSLNIEALRKDLGIVLNNNDIFMGTILENIQMGRSAATPNNINKAIEITGLDDFISSNTLGMNTLLDPEGKKVPRNIKERILLARAIAVKPKLLILEDPLEHFEASEKSSIIEALTKPENPWKILVTSVDPVWHKYIANFLHIEKGRLIDSSFKSGSHA